MDDVFFMRKVFLVRISVFFGNVDSQRLHKLRDYVNIYNCVHENFITRI